jgi:hypothetical protein
MISGCSESSLLRNAEVKLSLWTYPYEAAQFLSKLAQELQQPGALASLSRGLRLRVKFVDSSQLGTPISNTFDSFLLLQYNLLL